jgi:hypothetical protein
MRLAIAASFAAALASAGGAQTTSLLSSNPAAKTSSDPNRRICERVEKTGSRLGAGSVCMTAAQWAEIKREDREDLETAQRNMHQKLTR